MNILQLDSFQEKCTGCNACHETCKYDAIVMTQNNEGFYYPTINIDKCVNCGECVSVCQVSHSVDVNNPLSILVAIAKDESVRMSGSSGGMMKIFADEIISLGGSVYGAAFDSNSKTVIHTSTAIVPVQKLLRSKYVQSDISNCYASVESDLISAKPVLFCGTPCQVIGLKLFLGREYENLYTVDFFCHGVPSPGIFSEMIHSAEIEHGQSICDIVFRDKERGWRNQVTSIYFDNGDSITEVSKNTPFYFFFLNNYSLRRSCYACKYYNSHFSDITLADYWAAKNDDDKGISLVLVNTSNGSQILEKVHDALKIIESPKLFDFSVYSHSHGYDTDKRLRFFRLHQKKGIEYVFGNWFGRENAKYKLVLGIKRQILRLIGRGERIE